MFREHLEDRKLSKILFAYVWLMYAVVYMTKSCYSAAMASIVNEGIMTKSQTGLIVAVFYVVYAILQVYAGKLADKYVPEKIIAAGLAGSAVANLVIFLNQNYWVMLVTWTLNAVVQAGVWPAIFKIVSAQLKPSHRKQGAFYITFSSTFGLLLSYGCAIFVARWQYNFLISAVLLLVFGIGMTVIFHLTEKHMVRDEMLFGSTVPQEEAGGKKHTGKPGVNLFLESGFYILVPVILINNALANSAKTLTPTMLMESYDRVSPALGNSLNLIIIATGILGTVMVKFLLYPRVIKNEAKGILLFIAAIVPCMILLLWIGKVPVTATVIAMAACVLLTSGTELFRAYLTMSFAKFGKEGEAAGIVNAGASVGIVVQSYAVIFVADRFGWVAAAWFLLGLTLLAVILVAVMLPRWNRFRKKYEL